MATGTPDSRPGRPTLLMKLGLSRQWCGGLIDPLARSELVGHGDRPETQVRWKRLGAGRR